MSSSSVPSVKLKTQQLVSKRQKMGQYVEELKRTKETFPQTQDRICEVIDRAVEQHINLLRKWSSRWKTTVVESLDEKKDRVDKQIERFQKKCVKIDTLLDLGFVSDTTPISPRNSEHQHHQQSQPPQPQQQQQQQHRGGGEDTVEPRSAEHESLSAGSSDQKNWNKHAKKLDKWLLKEYTYEIEGTPPIDQVEKDFTLVLSESKASLKRSLVFVGGIFRGYIRKGKSRDFIMTMRQIEARAKDDYGSLDKLGEHGLIAPMNTYVAPPQLTISVIRRASSLWQTLMHIHTSPADASLVEAAVAQLYDHFDHAPDEVMFYLPQLCNMALQHKTLSGGQLRRFLLAQAGQSIVFALRVFLFVRAAMHQRGIHHDEDDTEDTEDMSESSESASTAARRCRWCDACASLLIDVRSSFARGRALKDSGVVDNLPRLVKDMKLKLKGSFTGDVSVNLGGVKRVLTPAPGSGVALNSFSISVTSSAANTVADPDDADSKPEADNASAASPAAAAVPDASSTDDDSAAAEAELFGNKDAYFMNQIAFMERMVDVSRSLKSIAVAQVAAAHNKMTTAAVAGKRKPKLPSASLATVDPEHLRQPLLDSLEALTNDFIHRRGGVFLPLHSSQPKGRVTRILKTFTRAIPTSTRILYSTVLELVNDAVLPTKSKYDDISFKTSAGNLLLERKKHAASAAASPRGDPSPATGDQTQQQTGPALVDENDASDQTQSHVLADAFGPLTWDQVQSRVASESPHGHDSGWQLEHVIIKHGDAMMQEHLAMQLIEQFREIFSFSSLNLHITPFNILPVSVSAGFIEATPDAVSIDALKRGLVTGFHTTSDAATQATTLSSVKTTGSVDGSSSQSASGSVNDTTAAAPGGVAAAAAAAAVAKDDNKRPSVSAEKSAAADSGDGESLAVIFKRLFGSGTREQFRKAHDNFVSSCAAYSIISYLLQIKDRHNANILLDRYGHIIHIDFGFVFNTTVHFEKAPFKLTTEFIDIMEMLERDQDFADNEDDVEDEDGYEMGSDADIASASHHQSPGPDDDENCARNTPVRRSPLSGGSGSSVKRLSPHNPIGGGARPTGAPSKSSSGFVRYCTLVVDGFLTVRRHYDRLLGLVEMSKSFGSAYPCLEGRSVLDDLRARFRLDLNDRQCAEFVLNLIAESRDNWRTAVFDSYQKLLNKIAM